MTVTLHHKSLLVYWQLNYATCVDVHPCPQTEQAGGSCTVLALERYFSDAGSVTHRAD